MANGFGDLTAALQDAECRAKGAAVKIASVLGTRILEIARRAPTIVGELPESKTICCQATSRSVSIRWKRRRVHNGLNTQSNATRAHARITAMDSGPSLLRPRSVMSAKSR